MQVVVAFWWLDRLVDCGLEEGLGFAANLKIYGRGRVPCYADAVDVEQNVAGCGFLFCRVMGRIVGY